MFQALEENRFDHYTAIYYLLLERLHCHRSNLPGEARADTRKRRPSTIAEQAMMHNNTCHRPALANVKTGMFSRTTDCVTLPQQSVASSQPLSDCCDATVPLKRSPGGAGPCGNMITTSIDEGVELDMASERGEQPTSSRTAGVYNNSSSTDGVSGGAPGQVDGGSGVLPSNVFGDLSQMASVTMSNQSISTGIGSAFTSFDSNTEADLMLGQSVGPFTCGGIVGPAGTTQLFGTATTTPPITSKFGHVADGARGCADALDERMQTHSPIHFREGRRASDGLMTQGIIVFKQRLKESMKTRGVAELQKEIGNLHHHCDMTCTIEELQALQEQHPCRTDSLGANTRQWSLNEGTLLATATERPKLTVKRKSLPSPGQMDMIPPAYRLMHLNNLKCSLDGGSSPAVTDGASEPAFGAYTSPGFVVSDYQNASPVSSSAKSLQQQLLHHRLQQKRQIFQKQSQQPLLHHHQLFQQFQALHIDSSQPHIIQEEVTPGSAANGHQSCVATHNCLAGKLASGHDVALPPGAHLLQFQHVSMCNCLAGSDKDRAPPMCNNSGVPPKPSLATFRQMSYKLAQQHPVAPQFRGDEPWQAPQLSAEQPLSTMFEEGAETDGLIGAGPYRVGDTSEHSQDEAATSMDTC